MPKIRSRLTIRGFVLGSARVVALSLLYVAAVKGAPFWQERHPLVLAWVLSNLIFFPNILREEFSKHQVQKGAQVVLVAFAALIFLFFFLVNDSLWVKRAISIFAVIELLFFLISLSQIERVRARSPNWDAKLFLKGQMFQGPSALVVLVVNEVAIWTDDDWLWIASRAFLVLLIPLVYVLVANTIRK